MVLQGKNFSSLHSIFHPLLMPPKLSKLVAKGAALAELSKALHVREN